LDVFLLHNSIALLELSIPTTSSNPVAARHSENSPSPHPRSRADFVVEGSVGKAKIFDRLLIYLNGY
jgi:hypothetical protein